MNRLASEDRRWFRAAHRSALILLMAIGMALLALPVAAVGPARLVKDINPAALAGAEPSDLARLNGALYFSAADGTHGRDLWRSDGTAAGTLRIKDTHPGIPTASIFELTDTAARLFFVAAADPDRRWSNSELWTSTGTPGGTWKLKSFVYGTTDRSAPRELTSVGTRLFFVANDDRRHVLYDTAIWTSDGTSAGTIPLKTFSTTDDFERVDQLTNANGIVYFVVYDNGSGSTVWRSNGTAAGTRLVYSGNTWTIRGMTSIGGMVFFVTEDDNLHRVALWRTDGTSSGTVMLKAVEGVRDGTFGHLTAVGSSLFFTIGDHSGVYELWKSDGSPTGTKLVKAFDLTYDPQFDAFANVRGMLFFSAFDPAHGQELWRSNGTADGTRMIKDIAPGSASSSPHAIKQITPEGLALFAAADGTNGVELWATDGQPGHTVRVQDIAAGVASSDPSSFTIVGQRVLFVADDAIHGRELWIVNTSQVADIVASGN